MKNEFLENLILMIKNDKKIYWDLCKENNYLSPEEKKYATIKFMEVSEVLELLERFIEKR